MKKIIGTLLTIGLSMYVGMTNINEAHADEIATVTINDLNVRSGPSTKYKVIAKVNKDTKVSVLKSSNGWSQVRLSNGANGWLSGKYLTVQQNDLNTSNAKADKVVAVAKQQIGKPYVWGASGPSSFDCSGLTSYAYKTAINHKLPRTSKEQSKVGTTISKSNLQKGDLIFFGSSSKNINHVGLYIGNSQMVHSPKPGEKVRIDNINSSYYSKRFVIAKRMLN
ncbi:MAG: NlpC/P60 family protein [Romboutsia sp.]|uniref:C40 family peptidase n=1 Tax=Romboutsia sp. TaxID=1965302 RepID=UPI003F36BE70